MKLLTSILAGAALALTPAIANASSHGGGGGGFHGGGGGGFHGGGAYHGGGGFRGGGGYRGGYYGGHGGYYGGRGWGYGPAFGLYLGYYANPWLWGYPYDYYGYPYYPTYDAGSNEAPPMQYSQSPQAPQAAAPQTCGSWQWDAGQNQYHWMTNGC